MTVKPKVLMTRQLPAAANEHLRKCVDLDIYKNHPIMAKKDLLNYIQNKDGLICLLTDNVDADVINKSQNLKIIANYAVGFNNIDVAAATKRGIAVTNTPGVLTETTADLTLALMLSVCRRIVEADKFVRARRFAGWEPMLMLGQDLYRKKLGIIGLGRIGQAVARRAQGFEMEIIYYETRRMPDEIERACRARYVTLSKLLKEADFITIHVPLTDKTFHMIGGRELKMMKKSAILINAARGPIIDEKAMINALENKDIAGCGLDVYEEEPKIDARLRKLSNVVLLPHIGSASIETRTKMAMLVADNVIAVLCRGEKPPNIVNPEIYN